MLSPLLDDNLSLFQAVEDFSVEQLNRPSELGNFFDSQEPPLFAIRWLFHAARRVVLDQFERLSGVF
jgi:hypothetical protein